MGFNPIKTESIGLSELKQLFKDKIFAIPDIQREFVWSKKKIVRLLDSIGRHYPIGTFLICKVPSIKSKHIREGIVLPSFNRSNKECYLVVDGQQRLSVLYSILFNKSIKTQKYSNELKADSICLLPPRGNDGIFGFYEHQEGWHLKLTDILAGTASSVKQKKRIGEVRRAFEAYSFPFIFIKGFDEKNMKEAFVRLNTGGTPLSQFDQIMTDSYSKDTDLRRHINELVKFGLKHNFEYVHKIEMNVFMAVVAALGAKDFLGSSLRSFSKKLANGRNSYHDDYVRKQKIIYQAIKLASDFLGDIVQDVLYLPYPVMLVILTVFYFSNKNRDPNDAQIREIMRWFWTTGFTERYSGAKQRDNLIADAEEMRELAAKKNYHLNLNARRRIEKFSINRLSTRQYTTRSVLRNTYFAYLINKKPIVFNGQPVKIGDVSSILNKKNDHHIFSRAKLREAGVRPELVNSVANICFLKFRDNIDAKENLPWVYFKPYKRKKYFRKLLSSNMIPYDSCVLMEGDTEEQFKKFMKIRKESIRKAVADKIGNKLVDMEERI